MERVSGAPIATATTRPATAVSSSEQLPPSVISAKTRAGSGAYPIAARDLSNAAILLASSILSEEVFAVAPEGGAATWPHDIANAAAARKVVVRFVRCLDTP
jgi:hypothetical protein